MRLFTFRDFIAYNNPCFSCNSPINFRIGFIDLESHSATISYLRPNVTVADTEIDLLITYHDILKLRIDHKTNKILTNNQRGLTNYLARHKLFLNSTCSSCYCEIVSRYLDFNLEKGFVNAVGIDHELLIVNDGENLYHLASNFDNDSSALVVDRIGNVKPLEPLILELPLIPKYKLKDKRSFIDKCKLLIAFS